MNAKEFQDILRTTGRYRTQCRSLRLPSWAATPLGYIRLSFIFVVGYLDAVFRKEFEEHDFPEFEWHMLRSMEKLGAEVTFEDFGAMRSQRFPVVWVSNHMSPLETYILPVALMSFSPLAIIMKESLVRYPFFGRIVRSIHAIRVQRQKPLEDLRTMLVGGTEMIRQGRSVLVFPEGRRALTFDPAAFNSIGVKLAARAGVPVVPIAIRTDAMQIGRRYKDLVVLHPERPIRVACGEPLEVGRDPRETLEAARSFISGKLALWQTEHDSGTPLLLLPPSSGESVPKE